MKIAFGFARASTSNYLNFTNTSTSCIPQAPEAFQSAIKHQFIPNLDTPKFASGGPTSVLQAYISPLQGYNAPLQGYNAPLQGYNAALHAYNAALQTYNAELQAYNAELQAYNSILQAYNSEIGACKMEIVIHFAFSGLRKKI